MVAAEVWQVEGGHFRIEADLRSVIQTHGPGIYSMVLQGIIQDRPEALTTYSIMVNGEATGRIRAAWAGRPSQ